MGGASNPSTVDEALVELLTSYHELNGAHVDELERAPSPLVFMQYVAKNRPFVVRGAAADWPAVSLWTPEYLIRKMENSTGLMIDGSRNADSAVRSPMDGRMYFTKPLEIDESFDELLAYVRKQEMGNTSTAEIKYSQARTIHPICDQPVGKRQLTTSEDDNMRGEYSRLYPDVAEGISWATECFGAKPDAINVWIGNSLSVTALHKDNYENIYCQVRGKKRFVLLPSVETPCVNVQSLAQAVYARDDDSVSPLMSTQGLSLQWSSRASDTLTVTSIECPDNA
ncbi:MAG: hypothetical protein Q9166_000516 [cf. Caloplaca sp. 2 TL-2023]